MEKILRAHFRIKSRPRFHSFNWQFLLFWLTYLGLIAGILMYFF
jgi:hypothetical protein